MSNDLIPTNATMTSLEIAELTGKRHDNVVRDLKDLEKQGVIALLSFEEREKYGSNNERTIYRLPKRETLILTSGYSAAQRATIIDRWLFLETTPQLPDFTNPIIAARAWADEAEAKQLAQAKVKELEPKAAFHDRVAQTPDLLTVREAAKVLRTGEKRLFRFLREESLLMRSNLPYQDYLNRGLFRVVETPYTDNLGRHRVSTKTCITQKGMVFIQGLQDVLKLS